MTKKRTQKLRTIANVLRHRGVSAHIGDDEYLLRFGENLVIMSDFGVTWEPSRAYPTPKYATLDIDHPLLIGQLMLLAQNEDALPKDTVSGEGAGEKLFEAKGFK